MRDSGAGPREQINLGPVQPDAMGVPDIGARPPRTFGILPRQTAELVQRKGHIHVIHGQMGVQHHALVARKNGERRARPTRTIAPSAPS